MSKTLREHIVETVEQYKAPPEDDIRGNLTQEAVERTYQSVALDLECILKITEGEEMDKQKINLIEEEISSLLGKIEDLKGAVADINREMSNEKEPESLWGRGAYHYGVYCIIVWDKPDSLNQILVSREGSGEEKMKVLDFYDLTLVPEAIENENEFRRFEFPEGSIILDADDTLYYRHQTGWDTHDGLDEGTIMFPVKVVKWNE